MTKKMAAIVGSVLALALTLLNNLYPNTFLFYALLPGTMLNLLITGVHGGTITENRIGFAAEVVVNSLVYLLAALLLFRMKKSSG